MRILIIVVIGIFLLLSIISNLLILTNKIKRFFNGNTCKKLKRNFMINSHKLKDKGFNFRKKFPEIKKRTLKTLIINTKGKIYFLIFLLCILTLALNFKISILNFFSLVIIVIIGLKYLYNHVIGQDESTKFTLGIVYSSYFLVFILLALSSKVRPSQVNIYYYAVMFTVFLVGLVYILNVVFSLKGGSMQKDLSVIISIFFIILATTLSYYAIGIGFIAVSPDIDRNLKNLKSNVDLSSEDVVNQMYTLVCFGIQSMSQPETIKFVNKQVKITKMLTDQYIQLYLLSKVFTTIYIAIVIGFFTRLFTGTKN